MVNNWLIDNDRRTNGQLRANKLRTTVILTEGFWVFGVETIRYLQHLVLLFENNPLQTIEWNQKRAEQWLFKSHLNVMNEIKLKRFSMNVNWKFYGVQILRDNIYIKCFFLILAYFPIKRFNKIFNSLILLFSLLLTVASFTLTLYFIFIFSIFLLPLPFSTLSFVFNVHLSFSFFSFYWFEGEVLDIPLAPYLNIAIEIFLFIKIGVSKFVNLLRSIQYWFKSASEC